MVREAAARVASGSGLSLRCLLLGLYLLLVPTLAGAADLRVAVISDLNGSYGSTDYGYSVRAAVARILDLRPDLVISTGDRVAGQRRPYLGRSQIERMWEAFHAQVTEPLSAAGIPLAVTPGNHDGSAYHGFEQERTIYAEQGLSRMPGVVFLDQAGYPFHYAFAAGDVLFVSLDATTVGHLSRDQMDWLREVLGKHGAEYRRRVVFSHVPLWPFAQGRAREYIGDPELHRLLAQADVDLFLSGHHHAFYPGSKDGVAFVSQSCLGAGPRHLLGAAGRAPKGFTLIDFSEEPLEITAFSAPAFDTPIDWETLPPRLHSSAAELLRADLAGTAQAGHAVGRAAAIGRVEAGDRNDPAVRLGETHTAMVRRHRPGLETP